MAKKKKVEDVEEAVAVSAPEVKAEEVVSVVAQRETFSYPHPETRADFLALIQCIKDCGATRIGDLEVQASRL